MLGTSPVPMVIELPLLDEIDVVPRYSVLAARYTPFHCCVGDPILYVELAEGSILPATVISVLDTTTTFDVEVA